MFKHIVIVLFLFCATALFAQPVLSCYDIQYNATGGNDSPYQDQEVSVQGIVTGINYFTGSSSSSYGFYIADPEGGPWSGLFVYNQVHHPAVGDLVQLIGTVDEYYEFTELTGISSFSVISTGNPIPAASQINTGALYSAATGESWESVLVKVSNITVMSAPSAYQEFNITDGSGACQVDNQFMGSGHSWSNVFVGGGFTEISGIVDYAFGTYGLNPRSLNDMLTEGANLSLSLPNLTTALESVVTVPLSAHNIDVYQYYQDYQLRLNFDPTILQYQSYSTTGTLSVPGPVTVTVGNGSLDISFDGNHNLYGSGTLLNFSFYAAGTGVSNLILSNVSFGDDTILNLIPGSVTVNSSYNSPGDTLTVIQQPILNIPAIHIPGESMAIVCLAPQNTSGFNAWLRHNGKRVSLPVSSSTWATNPNRWVLQTTIPQVPVFELYDLEVNANGGIHDISQNAVQVVPSRKSSYYFVHITDLHIPNRLFYPNAGYDTDSTEVKDYRAVMEDINLIRPEFVLITGDLINEGELEGFNNQYWYGWAQKLLAEMEVPVYLTSGNHDIGGWTSTPPEAGSSRRNWWRYFGWNWLDNTDLSWPYHTQDYFFTYNNTLFVGLESYDNYDYWRTNIYGAESYTDQQMAWLNNTLGLFPNHSKVLFHHYDFQDEINLSTLDLDMALWGHIHSNSGSISSYPYNLATRSTCSGNRAYRVVRVNNDQFSPLNTIYAGASGNTLSVSYFPSNAGVADSVVASINNGQSVAFENTLLKFIMPSGDTGYNLSGGGVIEQIDRGDTHNVCYVRVNLAASSVRSISIAANGVAATDLLAPAAMLQITACWPNPLRGQGELEIFSPKDTAIQLELYNLKGQKVQEFPAYKVQQGANQISFIPSSQLSSGIYFLRVKNSSAKAAKIVLMK